MSNGTSLDTLFERAEQYSKTSIELLKLKAIEKTADTMSTIVSQFFVFTVVMVFVLILSIGIALFLGDSLGKPYYGFFIIAGFYMLVGILLYLFRIPWVKMPVFNSMIKKAFK